jgi:predicted Rossmann-fold nucleotide-binding protein
MHSRVLGEHKISDGDLELMTVTDDPKEVVRIVSAAYKAQMKTEKERVKG